MTQHPGYEVLGRPECLELLSQGPPVGRVSVSIGALPVILPVYFSLFEESILIRTIADIKLDVATTSTVVAFQADVFEPGSQAGWSVLVQGLASTITDAAGLARARRLATLAAAGDTPERFVQIEPARVSGLRSRGYGPDGHGGGGRPARSSPVAGRLLRHD